MSRKTIKRTLFERRGEHGYGHDHKTLVKSLPEGLTDGFKVTTVLSRGRVAVYIHAPSLQSIPEALRPKDLSRPMIEVTEVDMIENED